MYGMISDINLCDWYLTHIIRIYRVYANERKLKK